MTEEELRDIEQRWADKPGTADWYQDVPDLIAEVRRLQSLLRPGPIDTFVCEKCGEENERFEHVHPGDIDILHCAYCAHGNTYAL